MINSPSSFVIIYWFSVKYFFQCSFQYFSIFICDESLPTKPYQFFKIYEHFHKEIEKKTLIQLSMRKEKLRKVRLCFITGCFIKSVNKMIINHFFSFFFYAFVHKIFFILQACFQRNFCFLISRLCKKYQNRRLGTTNRTSSS